MQRLSGRIAIRVRHCHSSRLNGGGVCYHGGYAEHLAFLIIEYDNATQSMAHLRVFISQLLIWDDGFTDIELGGHASIGLNGLETVEYWEAVTEQIASFIQNTQNNVRGAEGKIPIKRYLGTGELGRDPNFQTALRLAFQRTFAPHLVEELLASREEIRDPMTVPAVGAATLAKYYMVARKPLRCSESIECGKAKKEAPHNLEVETENKEDAHGEF